ncbi:MULTISPECIES: DNA polymerase I [unclassified Acinetobacter]|uniref:DNA polymerase I n=1 Tax=unclassified Acinetobacter TaxID=196816 RepID=UPI0035BAB20C
MPMPPFVLVDGSYFLFRAFHAVPPLTTSQGLHTHAVRGASAAIQKLMRRINPTHMAVIFDTPEPTFRHELSPIYKGDRPSMPPELAEQIPYLHDLIRALGIPLYSLAGVEADDIIGTLTQQAVAEGHNVLISTGDKDMAQLVNDKVTLEDSFKERVLDSQGVFEKFGVHPHQIIDYLTLMGDASDGIMGVAGIGQKTAAKLLNDYGNIENLLANVDQLKGKIAQSLKDSVETIKIDHQLATIVTGLPLNLAWDDLKLREPDYDKLKALYTELEFRTQLQSLQHPNHPSNSGDNTDSTIKTANQAKALTTAVSQSQDITPAAQVDAAQYHTVLDDSNWQKLLAKLSTASHFAFDTETTSVDYRQAELVGFSVAMDEKDAYYVPLAHDYDHAPQQLNRDTVLAQLKPILENTNIGKIGHHLKYDAHILQRYGIYLKGWAFDTMLASYVLNPTATRHNMDDVARVYLGHLTTSFEDIAGKGAKQLTFNQIDLSIAAPYACEDAFVTYRLYQVLLEKLKENRLLDKLLLDVELPVAQVLQAMENRGILLNPEFLQHLSQTFEQEMQRLEQQATDLAGESFNLASPKQVGEILFEKMGIAGGKKTASGQYSTSEAILEKIDHPIVQIILDYRGLAKLKGTYTDGLLKQADTNTQRVHTSYHQAVTTTGRLSSTDPNLQNIPIRGEIGRQIRQAFVAPKERVLLAADYSQIELRLMAHFCQDEALVEAFRQGKDIHQATAAEVLGIAIEDVTADQRRQAKAVNFGLLYGMSEFGLTRQLGFSRAESQSYIKQYFSRYPGIYEYMQRTRQLAHEQGYVETLLGRRLYTPDIYASNKMVRQAAERAAINAPLQGSAADIIKLAMIAIEQKLDKQRALLLLQVHDELVFEVDEDYADEAKVLIQETMQNVIQLDVPLVVEVGRGQNWDEAH